MRTTWRISSRSSSAKAPNGPSHSKNCAGCQVRTCPRGTLMRGCPPSCTTVMTLQGPSTPWAASERGPARVTSCPRLAAEPLNLFSRHLPRTGSGLHTRIRMHVDCILSIETVSWTRRGVWRSDFACVPRSTLGYKMPTRACAEPSDESTQMRDHSPSKNITRYVVNITQI